MKKETQSCFILILILLITAGFVFAGDVPKITGVVEDHSSKLLIAPEALTDSVDFIVAQTAARIRFSVVEGCYPLVPDNPGVWSSWSQSLLASDGNYYCAIGNHQGVDGHTFVIRYEPATGKQTLVFDSHKVFKHQPGTFGHGKIHGRLDEYPRGKIVGLSYWGMPPTVTVYKGEAFLGEVPGGRLFQIDIQTGTATDLGCPFERDSWPMFATDTQRGIIHAVGLDRHYLAYDLTKNEPLFAALPPPNITWSRRATLVDEVTGNCYSTSLEHFVKFDLASRKIEFMQAKAPINPFQEDIPNNEYDKYFYLRSHTQHRTQDDAYFCQTFTGMIFKFFPDEDRVETLGPNWGKGCYCTSMALSPGQRYLYYTVDVHGSAYKHGCPVIQYDLKTRQPKVIAFLHPFYADKYDYVFGGSYSVNLNLDGSQLFIVWNGKFSPEREGESFGDPTFMLLDIPAAEREE